MQSRGPLRRLVLLEATDEGVASRFRLLHLGPSAEGSAAPLVPLFTSSPGAGGGGGSGASAGGGALPLGTGRRCLPCGVGTGPIVADREAAFRRRALLLGVGQEDWPGFALVLFS